MRSWTSTILLALLVITTLVEVVSLVYWIAYPYLSVMAFFAQLDLAFFHGLAPLAPLLVVVLLYLWIGIVVVTGRNRFSTRIRLFFAPVAKSLDKLRFATVSVSRPNFQILDHPRVLLVIGMFASFFLAVIPYRADLNPTGAPVGVDFHYYVEWVQPMLSLPITSALAYALGSASSGSRPLLLIPIYLVVSTRLVDLGSAVRVLPMILGPAVVGSVYFFVGEAFTDRRLAGFTALVTALSFNITVGIWAGYYANMLALVLGYLFLGELFAYSKSSTTGRLVLATGLGLAMLLAHPWTWIIIIASTFVFAVTDWWKTRGFTILKLVVMVFALGLSFDLAKGLVFGGSIVPGEVSSAFALELFVPRALNFWGSIIAGELSAYQGILSNTLFWTLSIIGLLSLTLRNTLHRFLHVWIAVCSIPIIVLSPLGQTRILYDLPIPVLAGFGSFHLLKRFESRRLYSILGFVLTILLLANYAIRSVLTLVGVPF